MAYNAFSFWKELKQRKVIHVITLYIASAFGLLELADIISGYINIPDLIIFVIMVAAIIGFPVSILFTWFFITTSDGIKFRKNIIESEWNNIYLTDYEQVDYDPDTVFDSDDLVPYTLESPGKPGKARKRKEKIYRSGSFVVIIASVVLFFFFSGKSIPFESRDWVVISDFENNTGEEIFDNSLNTAFVLSIDQSQYINVIPRQRMHETLKRMRKDNIVHINEESGREIAVREGVAICIVPAISRVGNQYILTAKVLEAESGKLIRSEVIYASHKDEIIEKLDKLSHRIRRNLGESRYKISGKSKPLAEVTTSSLNALKQYSLAFENHRNLEYENALSHYQNAIQIDSTFTAAKASLGNLLYERFDKEEGKKWLEEAIITIDDLTDIEKYAILAFYAVNIEGDLDKAIQYEKTATELYPDESAAHNNLGWYYMNMGDFKKAVEEYKIALSIDPNMMLSYSSLNNIFLSKLGLIDSVLVWSKKMIEYGPDNPYGHLYLGCAYVCIDSLEKAEIEFLKTRNLDPLLFINQYNLAHVYRLMGKYQRAAEVLEEFLKTAPYAAPAYYQLGVIYNLIGEDESARKHLLEFKKNAETWVRDDSGNPFAYYHYGLVLTRLGEINRGWEFGKKIIEVDTTAHIQFAEFLAAQGRTVEALDHLEIALEAGYRELTWLKLSPDLSLLHNEKKFQMLINEYFLIKTI